MPRPYSDKLILSLNRADPKNIGVKLGKACVHNNLPLTYVAKILGVSRECLYIWFREGTPQKRNNIRINHFIELVEEGLESGVLPANSMKAAKEYLEKQIEPNLTRAI